MRHSYVSYCVIVLAALLLSGCTDGSTVENVRAGASASDAEPVDGGEASSGAREHGGEDDTVGDDDVGTPPGLPDPDDLDLHDIDVQIDAVIACIEARGYAARREGRSVRTIPTGDTSERRAALEFCTSRYSPPAPDPTPEWWGRVYDAQLEAAECLREQGVSVPDPPSREAFIENPDWFPHAYAGQIAGYSASEARRFEEACPQPQVE